MIKFINSIININKLNTYICRFLKFDEPMSMLGRWCHVNMPKCNHEVLIKKIDMANHDNNYSIKEKTKTFTKN